MPEQSIPTLMSARSPGSSQFKQNTGGGPAALAVVIAEKVKDWALPFLLAATVIILVIVSAKLYSADKDLQTQAWLRDDALTKFLQGPWVQTQAQLIALQSGKCPQEKR